MRGRYVLFFVVSILVAAAAWQRAFRRGPPPAALAAGRRPTRVEIRRPREDITLMRDDGPWRILREDDLADGEAVERLLAGLRALEFGPAAAPPESAFAYGLGPADSVRVRVLDGNGLTLFDGLFGRRAFGRSSYFRASERDWVRLASGFDPELLRLSSLVRRWPHGR